MNKAVNAYVVPLLIALLAVITAGVVVAAATLHPPTWQRVVPTVVLQALPASKDAFDGHFDGMWVGGSQYAESPNGVVVLPAKARGGVDVQGWAFDGTTKAPFRSALVSVDREPFSAIGYGTPRADVARVMSCSSCLESGYRVRLSGLETTPGRHQVRLEFVTSADKPEVTVTTPVVYIVR